MINVAVLRFYVNLKTVLITLCFCGRILEHLYYDALRIANCLWSTPEISLDVHISSLNSRILSSDLMQRNLKESFNSCSDCCTYSVMLNFAYAIPSSDRQSADVMKFTVQQQQIKYLYFIIRSLKNLNEYISTLVNNE